MASARALARVERLIWTLVYGGIFAVILGVASGGAHRVAGWSLGVLGGAAVAAGVILIWVRSRMHEAAPGGAQSSSPPETRRENP
jgi:hypothetical protein